MITPKPGSDAYRILQDIAEEDGGWNINDVANGTGLSRDCVQKNVYRLRDAGYLDDSRYRLYSHTIEKIKESDAGAAIGLTATDQKEAIVELLYENGPMRQMDIAVRLGISVNGSLKRDLAWLDRIAVVAGLDRLWLSDKGRELLNGGINV